MKTHRWLMHVQPCGATCATVRRGYSAAKLNFGPNGRVTLEESGELAEKFRAAHGKKSERFDWERTWRGGWTLGTERLSLDLDLADDACARTDLEPRAEAACEAVAPQKMKLTCRRRQLSLRRPERKVVWSWVCNNPALDLAAFPTVTPLPWVFAETTEVVALDKGRTFAPKRSYVDVDATPAQRDFYR